MWHSVHGAVRLHISLRRARECADIVICRHRRMTAISIQSSSLRNFRQIYDPNATSPPTASHLWRSARAENQGGGGEIRQNYVLNARVTLTTYSILFDFFNSTHTIHIEIWQTQPNSKHSITLCPIREHSFGYFQSHLRATHAAARARLAATHQRHTHQIERHTLASRRLRRHTDGTLMRRRSHIMLLIDIGVWFRGGRQRHARV